MGYVANNLNMDKWLQPLRNLERNNLSLPKLQRGVAVEVWEWISNFTHTSACDYLSILGLTSIDVSKKKKGGGGGGGGGRQRQRIFKPTLRRNNVFKLFENISSTTVEK